MSESNDFFGGLLDAGKEAVNLVANRRIAEWVNTNSTDYQQRQFQQAPDQYSVPIGGGPAYPVSAGTAAESAKDSGFSMSSGLGVAVVLGVAALLIYKAL